MSNILLVSINAKFIHSNLAVRYIRKHAKTKGIHTEISEFTINQHKEFIVSSIYDKNPEIIGFSCYIWNIELIKNIVSDIKKILPFAIIVLGGPEVSFDAGTILKQIPEADFIVSGGGEEAFCQLITSIENKTCTDNIPHVASKTNMNTCCADFDINIAPFPYSGRRIKDLKGRIIYYETQRGCPFNCAYCLSSSTKGVNYLNLNRVYKELMFFLNNDVKLVKLVDRTFNSNKNHRIGIWSFLINNDNGKTCFHFEICAELLDNDDFELLSKAREGLFQFEIGVQSTHEKTLSAIDRKTNLAKLHDNVIKLKNIGGIHLHVDLIAGLPYEDLTSFEKSFNFAFGLQPDALQLGFLKVLKGCSIREKADKYKLIYSDRPPYEVLATKDLSFADIQQLKNIEHVLNCYYNSSLALKTTQYALHFTEPFTLFNMLASYWKKNGCFGLNHTKMKLFETLASFLKEEFLFERFNMSAAKDAIVFDILMNDNIKTIPGFISAKNDNSSDFAKSVYKNEQLLKSINAELLKFHYKQLIKQCNVAIFDYNVLEDYKMQKTAVFFHYLSGKGSAYLLKGEEGME